MPDTTSHVSASPPLAVVVRLLDTCEVEIGVDEVEAGTADEEEDGFAEEDEMSVVEFDSVDIEVGRVVPLVKLPRVMVSGGKE